MYVTAEVDLTTLDGECDTYEVGADVDYESSGAMRGYHVGEPEVSAANCTLRCSRIVDTDTLEHGWSELAEEALVAAYEGSQESAADAAADHRYDMQREEEY